MSDDDHHFTVRMGSSEDICNIQGHIYVVCKDNDIDSIPLRTMSESERSIKGGKSPHYWVWGNYPPESRDWPRAGIKYPNAPFEILANSILQYQIEQQRLAEEAAAAAGNKKGTRPRITRY